MRTRDRAAVYGLASLPGRAAAVFAVVGPFAAFACFMAMGVVRDRAHSVDFVVHMGPYALAVAYIAGLVPALLTGLLAGAAASVGRPGTGYGAAAVAGFGVTALAHAAISDNVVLHQAAAMGVVGAVAGLVSMAVLHMTLRRGAPA